MKPALAGLGSDALRLATDARQAPGSLTRTRIEETVREVLADRAFEQREGSSLLERWLAEQFSGWGTPGASSVATFVAIFVCAVLAGLLALGLARIAAAAGARRAPAAARSSLARATGSAPSLFERAQVAWRAAEEARARGELRAAAGGYFTALVSGLGATGRLEYDPAWTNRELVAQGRPASPWDARLSELVERNEAKRFGGRATTDADVEELRELCTQVPELARGERP